MIKIDSFIVNKGTNSSSNSNGGGFANTITVQKKLEKHKLWGQEFDGTNDVDGDMTINGNANISGNVTATNGNITNVNSTTINNNGNIVNGGNITNTGNLKTAEANVTNDLTVGNNANVGTVNATNGNITTVNSSNITNADTIKTKNLQVTGTAHFFNLIIDKIKSAGGAALFTPADGFDVDIVQDDTNEVKLLWQCQDEDGNQRDNMWKVNDQALCMSFNRAKVGTTHNVSNKYYWALVTGVNKIDEPLVVDGVKYNYISLSKTIVDGVLNPEFGDSIVMCGYRGTDDAARQSAIYISAYSSLDNGLTAPLLAQYQGINDFNLESHRNSYYDAIGAKFVGDFVIEGQSVMDFINDKIKVVDDKYSSLSATVDGINTKVVNNTTSITKLGENLETANNNITALETTVSNNYSTLDQKADGISAKVSENTTTINNINGQVTENKTNIANLSVKADGIESTVSSMSNGNGTNLFSFTNANFNNFNCRPSIQMNGFFTLGLNQRLYRVMNLGCNGVTGDYVVSFDAMVWKGSANGTVVNVNFCDEWAIENNSDITLTTEFKHYVLHFKNIQSAYLRKDLYDGFIDFEPKVQDANNQLYVANFMLERGNIPSSNFSLSEADRNNFKSNNVFTAFEAIPTATLVDETINGNAVKAYKQEGLPEGSTYVDILRGNSLQKKFKVEPWKIYTLSFWAKTLEGNHRISMFLFPNISNTGLQNILYKDINGAGTQTAYTAATDGYTICELDNKWRKFYVHWQPHQIGSEYDCICGRLNEDVDDKGNKVNIYIYGAKLEEGYICDENISNQDTYSSIKQTAESITSTVSSMKDEMIGENGMLGLSGQGWSSNTIYQDAANVFYCESTDWFQSHPIADFSGDYTFSFSFWGGNMQIKILDFTQTYYDDGIYDQYVDFSVYKPCKILTTSSSVSNVDLSNYANSGTSSTWTYTNTEAITLAVGDNVAVRVTNSTNNRYNSIYGTVSAINTSTKSVTVKAIALLDQPNTICTLSCPTDKKDGTDINSLHYDDKLGRYWIRFKESSAAVKTFVMQFRNLDTSSIGYISRLMIEEGVERPHKYNGTGQASQSMIKQTANEIIAQVNDTYVKIGDGNITLNGDTKVNGSLTLNNDKQGFLLMGNGGTTEISPKSIGSYSAFKDRTSNTIRTHYLSDIHGELNVGTNNYAFFWSVTQKLGTYKKGDYIKLTNYTNDVVTSVGTNIGTPYAKFYVNENGTQTKAIDIGVKTNVDIDNYTVVNDNADIQVTGQFHIYAPKSIWNQARGIDTNIPNIPFISVTVEWDNEVPNKNSFMLIGYDGWGVNFGSNKTVYCGNEGFIASFGDSLFKINSDGIVEKKNGANVAIVNGSSSIYSPSYYNLKEGVDTILCKSGYTIITLPSEPYQGQSVKIFDKSPQEVYVNFNGYMVGANSNYNSRTHQTKYALDSTAVRTFTYIGDTWFMEYMG